MIRVKPGASIEGCGPEILRALIKVDSIYIKLEVPTVVTSGSENYEHTAVRSAHYRGDAIDLRVKNVPKQKRARLASRIKAVLGKDYIVIHEGIGHPWEHIHIHWSPVYKEAE